MKRAGVIAVNAAALPFVVALDLLMVLTENAPLVFAAWVGVTYARGELTW